MELFFCTSNTLYFCMTTINKSQITHFFQLICQIISTNTVYNDVKINLDVILKPFNNVNDM